MFRRKAHEDERIRRKAARVAERELLSDPAVLVRVNTVGDLNTCDPSRPGARPRGPAAPRKRARLIAVCAPRAHSRRARSFLQTTFLISSLLVGVSLALLSLLGWEQLERVREKWFAVLEAADPADSTYMLTGNGGSWESPIEYYAWLINFMYDSAVTLAYLGVMCSGAQFATALMIYSSLRTLDIHPEDYSSATIFENNFRRLLTMMDVVGALSFLAIAVGTASCTNLYFQPTLFGLIGARIGYLLIPYLAIAGGVSLHVHRKVSAKLAHQRAVRHERLSSPRVSARYEPPPSQWAARRTLVNDGGAGPALAGEAAAATALHATAERSGGRVPDSRSSNQVVPFSE
jgi:hypothetical protein